MAWLVARAAGIVAFALLTISVTLGLALSTKLLGNRRGKMLLGWHQTLIWTGLGMVVLHLAGLLLDPVLRFGFVAVLVPGAAPWRPLPVAAGIVTCGSCSCSRGRSTSAGGSASSAGGCSTTRRRSRSRSGSTTRSTSAAISRARAG